MASLVTLLLAAAIGQAAVADFSGVWTLDTARSETMKEGGDIDRGPLTVTQTTETFRVAPSASASVAAGQKTISYPILTAVARARAPAGSEVAFWDGPALVTERQGLINGKSVTVKQSRTLAPGGGEMVVDTTVAIQHGYKEGEPLPMSKARDVYVRGR